MSARDVANGILILCAAAGETYVEIAAEHDVIYCGPHPDEVDEGTKTYLRGIGWDVDEHGEGFRHFA